MGRIYSLILIAVLMFSCENGNESQGDSFKRSVPEREGVQTEGILTFIEEVKAAGIDMHSLLILRHGKIITEAYWYPYQASHRHIMHSVSKTFTSTAIGFAVQEKLLTVNDRVISFFPDDLPAEKSPYLEELTVKHLLTMSVGQDPAPSFLNDGSNWVKDFLATPIVNKPGSVFLYSSYATYMLSAIVQKVSGQTTLDYLKPRLFEPLHLDSVVWEKGAQDISAGGWGMRITTMDMARLGQFYLQNGRWNGKQLLDEKWIKEASAPQIFQRDNLTYEEEMYDNWVQGYGYQIWRCINNAYRADGANGQFIIVMPDEDAVVVITENTTRTQEALNLVFKRLQAVMMPNAIVYSSDSGKKEMLPTAISSLNIAAPFDSMDDDDSFAKDKTESYAFESNKLDISQAKFQFDGTGNCRLSITVAGKEYDYNCGLDVWKQGTSSRLSPYFLSPRRNSDGFSAAPVAGYCSWTAKGELSLRLLYVEDYQDETFVCRFSPNKVTIEYRNSFDKATVVALSGSLAQ